MADFLETTVDKFIFRVAVDRLYSPDGVWVQELGKNHVRLGLSDFFQQRNGDVAFATVQPTGTALAIDDEIASIETIKVNLSIPSPLSGKVAAVNSILTTQPEKINQDPYGEGWLCEIQASAWDSESKHFFSPQEYFEKMKKDAEEEVKK